jgi:hypothetical protein
MYRLGDKKGGFRKQTTPVEAVRKGKVYRALCGTLALLYLQPFIQMNR